MDLNLFIFKVTVLNDEHEYLTSIITNLLGFSKKHLYFISHTTAKPEGSKSYTR